MSDTSAPSSSSHLVLPYIAGLIGLGVIGVIVTFAIRPDRDSTVLISLIIAFLGTGIGQILTLVKAQDTYAKAEETHKVVNSQMDAFKRSLEQTAREAAALAYAQGRADGRAVGVEAANQRTDHLAAAGVTPTPVDPAAPVTLVKGHKVGGESITPPKQL